MPPRKAKDLAALKDAAKYAERVIIATDPDREGEAIGWHVARLLAARNPERLEFHEITARAIREALAHPRGIDGDLVEAQEARRILDRMVGYKASPALIRTVKRGLSVGRVQSVAMALVADREREIAAFSSREYWTIVLTMRRTDGTEFSADLRLLDGAELDCRTINHPFSTTRRRRGTRWPMRWQDRGRLERWNAPRAGVSRRRRSPPVHCSKPPVHCSVLIPSALCRPRRISTSEV